MLTEAQKIFIKKRIEEEQRIQYLSNSIIEDVGVMLGYSISDIEQEMEKCDFFPDGGEKGVSINYKGSGIYLKSAILNEIFVSLYEIVGKNKIIEFLWD